MCYLKYFPPSDIHSHHIIHHFHYFLHQSAASNSQDGLSEAELKDLEDKGSAGLGEAVGPIVGCLSNEYQQVKALGDVKVLGEVNTL